MSHINCRWCLSTRFRHNLGQSGWYIHENIVFPGHVEPSLCHVSEWADVALPLQVQVCRCNLEGFNARRGACGWSHRFSVVSNQIWVAHVDDVDYNVLERFASPALGFLGHVEASYIYLKNFRFRIATAGVQHLWRYGLQAVFRCERRRGRPSGCIQVSAHGSAVFQTIFRPSVGGCGGHVLANMPTFLFSSSSTLGFPGQV